jgi:hypothetical protein
MVRCAFRVPFSLPISAAIALIALYGPSAGEGAVQHDNSASDVALAAKYAPLIVLYGAELDDSKIAFPISVDWYLKQAELGFRDKTCPDAGGKLTIIAERPSQITLVSVNHINCIGENITSQSDHQDLSRSYFTLNYMGHDQAKIVPGDIVTYFTIIPNGFDSTNIIYSWLLPASGVHSFMAGSYVLGPIWVSFKVVLNKYQRPIAFEMWHDLEDWSHLSFDHDHPIIYSDRINAGSLDKEKPINLPEDPAKQSLYQTWPGGSARGPGIVSPIEGRLVEIQSSSTPNSDQLFATYTGSWNDGPLGPMPRQ